MKKIPLVYIFVRNLKIFLTLKGYEYTDLYELCHHQLSVSFIATLRHAEKINPTLKVISILAQALKIAPTDLLDPNLNYSGKKVDVPGYIRREVLVTPMQNLIVKDWEEINEETIKRTKQLQLERAMELAKK